MVAASVPSRKRLPISPRSLSAAPAAWKVEASPNWTVASGTGATRSAMEEHSGGFGERGERGAKLHEGGTGRTGTDLLDDVVSVGELDDLSFWKLLAGDAVVDRQLKNREPAGEAAVRRRLVLAQDKGGLIGVQPGQRNVNPLTAVGQVDHERPKVEAAPAERLFGAGSGLYPLKRDATAAGRLVHGLYGDAGGTAFRDHLDGGYVLKTDAQRTARHGRRSKREVPKPDSDC